MSFQALLNIQDAAFWSNTSVLLSTVLFSYVLEDGALIMAALLAATNYVSPLAAWFAAFFGIFTGDLAVYGIARLFRNPVKSWRKHIPMPSLYELIICRFTPGLRTVSYSWCGLSKMPVWRFTLIVFWSGLAWTMLVFSLVYYIGIRSENWLHYYAWFAVPIALMLFFWQRRSLIRKVSHEE